MTPETLLMVLFSIYLGIGLGLAAAVAVILSWLQKEYPETFDFAVVDYADLILNGPYRFVQLIVVVREELRNSKDAR